MNIDGIDLFSLEIKGPITLPEFSNRSLEDLAIAVMGLRTKEGFAVNIPMNWILTPQILVQFAR